MGDKKNGVSLQQQGLNSQLLTANTPSVDAGYYNENATVVTGYYGRDALICRYLLSFSFIVAGFLFMSPFVFFILSFSVVKRFGQASTDNDGNDYDLFSLVSVSSICSNNASDCFRFIFFAVYVSIFGILFLVMCGLFLHRRDKHPLRSRSIHLLGFTVIAIFFWVIWACLGIMYDVSWLGCTGTHIFVNIFYPMMILPYWFRAFRIKKIFEQANLIENYGNGNLPHQLLQSTHNHENRKNKSKDKRNNTKDKKSKHEKREKRKRDKKLSESTDAMSTERQRSNSNIVVNQSHNDDISMEFSIDSRSTTVGSMTNTHSLGEPKYNEQAKIFARTLENRLLLYLALSLLPFVIISVFNGIYGSSIHVLPDFSSECDNKTVSIIFWMLVHFIEILLLLTTIYLIRLVWRAFSVKQELIWVVVIDVIFCACNLGFSINSVNIDSGVLTIYCILIRCIGLFVVSIMWPLYRSYFSIALYIPNADVITSLEAILEDEEATVEFRRFMQDQDSQYLLDCWMEIFLFKDAFASDPQYYNNNIIKGNSEALKIYQKYFDINNNSKASNGIRNIVPPKFCKSMKKIFDKVIVQIEQRELRMKLQNKKSKKNKKRSSNKNKNKNGNNNNPNNNNNNITHSRSQIVTSHRSNNNSNINDNNDNNNNSNNNKNNNNSNHSMPMTENENHNNNNNTNNNNNNNSSVVNIIRTHSPRSPMNGGGGGVVRDASPMTPHGSLPNEESMGMYEDSISGMENIHNMSKHSSNNHNINNIRTNTYSRNSSMSMYDSEDDIENECSIMNEMDYEDLTRVEPIIFDYPQKLIFEHMENLHYRLFLRSEYCKSLLNNIEQKEAIFTTLMNEQVL